MPPLPSHRRRRSVGPAPAIAALAAIAVALAVAVIGAPADAHGSRWGTAARASSTNFHAYLTEFDVLQDGHCAQGRFHLNGSWRVVATDCSHSPAGSGVHSGYWGAQGTISVSSCLSNHSATSSTCFYAQYQSADGTHDLGNVP